jgi:hypothetical protein
MDASPSGNPSARFKSSSLGYTARVGPGEPVAAPRVKPSLRGFDPRLQSLLIRSRSTATLDVADAIRLILRMRARTSGYLAAGAIGL